MEAAVKSNPVNKNDKSAFKPGHRTRTSSKNTFSITNVLDEGRCVQTALRINQPDDKFEQEADSIAEKVVNSQVENVEAASSFPNPHHDDSSSLTKINKTTNNTDCSTITTKTHVDIQRVCSQCEEEIQRKADERGEFDDLYSDGRQQQLIAEISKKIASIRCSGGQALANREFFEQRMGYDFSDVHIHTGEQAHQVAKSLGAKAFTTGSDIVFAYGEYQPFSFSGKTLLAHELVHTIQQQGTVQQLQRACGDAGCDVLDPDTPDCPEPEEFFLNVTLESIRQSVFDGPAGLIILERGDSGLAVTLLQKLLLNSNCTGYDRVGLRAELAAQRYGRHTDEAVRVFQADNNDSNGIPLTVDGDVGPATLSAMDVILELEPINPALDPEGLGQCFGTAEQGPGEARTLANSEIIPFFPFFPAYKSWELSNFDIDESFVKTEHRQFIRSEIFPALRDAEIDFPDAEDIHLRLVGEASTTASDAYNFALSARRTHCVRESLIDEGVRGEDILDHAFSALGEVIARERLRAVGSPVDEIEDRHSRKVTVILDLTSEEENESCNDADKMLASSLYKAKIACAGSSALRINIGNFANPEQPVYREFIWQRLPLLDGCFFRVTSSPQEFLIVAMGQDMQLATRNPDEASAHSDFQGVLSLKTAIGSSFLQKDTVRRAVYQILFRGAWNEQDCLTDHDDIPGEMRPIGPVKCGVVPTPPIDENCYPSSEEDDCPDDVRQALAQEFVATMVRISGDPTEALKQIKRIAKFVEVIDWVLDFIGLNALLGGAAVVIGSKDLQQPILRPFIFVGGGITGAGEDALEANMMVSKPFTLDNPKQLENNVSGLLLNGSDFSGSASITIVGGTNREELTIHGNGFSKTIPLWGLPCDGGSTRTAHGRLMAMTNAKCLNLPALPSIERECDDECSENLRVSGFNNFRIKIGRASYSAVPVFAQRIADSIGGCGATMAFVNVANRPAEDETEVFREFIFIGKNINCIFDVARGETNPSYTFARHLAYGDANDAFAFSDFAGLAFVDSFKVLTLIDLPWTSFGFLGDYSENCQNGSIEGLMLPLAAVECGSLPDPLHITTPDPTDADRCNTYKNDHTALVMYHISKLYSDYTKILDTIDSGPALRYPNYRQLYLQIGETIPNAAFVGKTHTGERVVSFMDIEVLSGARAVGRHYIFHVIVLTEPCTFNEHGDPVLLRPENCREGFIKTGPNIIFPVIRSLLVPQDNPGSDDPSSDVLDAKLTTPIQTKLNVSQPINEYEKEANDVADKVVDKQSEVDVQRVCSQCEDEQQLNRHNSNTKKPLHALSTDMSAIRNVGQPLRNREYFEQRMGHDFSSVKIHTDAVANKEAQQLGAKAFTHQNHIIFSQGQYSPEGLPGKKLLAHELTHVVQQNAATGSSTIMRQPASTGPCTDIDKQIDKVVVQQETPQSATIYWDDGSVESDICSSGKGTCCVDANNPSGIGATVAESRVNNSNWTPITEGTGYTVYLREEDHNGIPYWTEFNRRRIALHKYSPVDGTPLSHGCVRLRMEFARKIYCGSREQHTKVQVRGFARPQCNWPNLISEWRNEFSRAQTHLDGEETDPDKIRANRGSYRLLQRGTDLSGDELDSSIRDVDVSQQASVSAAIPRCTSHGAVPTREERRLYDYGIPTDQLPDVQRGHVSVSTPVPVEVLAESGFHTHLTPFTIALRGVKSLRHARTAVRNHSRRLWQAARSRAQDSTSPITDDRPLYWARLEMIRALRQWEPSIALSDSQRESLMTLFERTSRGMNDIDFSTADDQQLRILITGFDPFFLDADRQIGGDIRNSNPSGAAVLALDGSVVTNGSLQGRIEGVIFPVRYRDFNQGIVESVLEPFIRGETPVNMVMTISRGNRDFELEQFAGRARFLQSQGRLFPFHHLIRDNLGRIEGLHVPEIPPDLTGDTGVAGAEFRESSLPMATIQSAMVQQGIPVVIDPHVEEVITGGNGMQVHVSQTGPTPGSFALKGSGGGFLSNEISYRAMRIRDIAGVELPVGHLHVPVLGNNPEQDRVQIANTIKDIISAALPDIV